MCMIPFLKNWKRNIYVEMILIPFTEVIEDDNFIYQNDNAPVYALRHINYTNLLFKFYFTYLKSV